MSSLNNEKLSLIAERFNGKIKEQLKEDFPNSFKVWIEPIEVIGYDDGKLILYHWDCAWVDRHYGARIKELVNTAIRWVNEKPEAV